MTDAPADRGPQPAGHPDRLAADPPPPQFRYVEEFVRHQLSESLGGARGMVEAALPLLNGYPRAGTWSDTVSGTK